MIWTDVSQSDGKYRPFHSHITPKSEQVRNLNQNINPNNNFDMKKTFLLLIMMLCTLSSWSAEEEYDLWFQGVRVTSSNCDDLLWGGMVRYDASSKTLFVSDNVWINNDYVNDYAIVNNIAGLTIQFNGNLIGIGGMKGAIYSTEYFTISGNGADDSGVMITDNNSDSPAIYAEKGVMIQWCNVAIYGVQDSGIEGDGILTLNGGKMYSNVVKGFEEMRYYNGSYLKNPKNEEYDTENKILGGGISYVQVDVRVAYQLYVAGIEVTNENAEDILNNQTVSYDPTIKTLTLKNANIEYDNEVIHSFIDDLTIRVIGDNVLTSRYAGCIDFQGEHMTIEGYTPSRSTLKFQQNYEGTTVEVGTSFFGGSTLIKNCTVSGYKFVNVIDTKPVNLEMFRARISVANIEGFDEVKVSNAYIETPVACSYDVTQKCFMEGSDRVPSLHIEPYLLTFNGQDVTPSSPIVTKSGVATYDADARILTMNNAEIGEMTTGEGFTFYDDLIIKLEGNNKLNAQTAALRFEAGDLTIQGPGMLQISANEDAFATSYRYDIYYDTNAGRFNLEQFFTLKKTSLFCWTNGRRSMASNLIFNVNNSDFTFDKNPVGYEFLTFRNVNLTNCKLIEPEGYDIGQYSPMFDGKIVIEALGDIPGDLDGDGEVTPSDLANMIKCLGHINSITDISVYDVDGDRRFTKNDIDALVDILLGK